MTRIAPIRYYQGRVAYPQLEQLLRARSAEDFDDGHGNRPTEDVDCTHLQVLEVRGATAEEARWRSERILRRFFDYVGYKRGFRVLTHETNTNSHRGDVTIAHEIVYVIESRPTKGYVKLKLKPRPQNAPIAQPSPTGAQDPFQQIRKMFDQRGGSRAQS